MTWEQFWPLLLTGLLAITASVAAQIVAAYFANRRAREDRLLDQKRAAFVQALKIANQARMTGSPPADFAIIVFEVMMYDVPVSDALLTALERPKEGTALPALVKAMAKSLGTEYRPPDHQRS